MLKDIIITIILIWCNLSIINEILKIIYNIDDDK